MADLKVNRDVGRTRSSGKLFLKCFSLYNDTFASVNINAAPLFATFNYIFTVSKMFRTTVVGGYDLYIILYAYVLSFLKDK
jgi:hypothetical protein